jgi:L,D-peptidoglycan transpeptidase YkuD (ErfK/YbiS/YcfS/YnhG family)
MTDLKGRRTAFAPQEAKAMFTAFSDGRFIGPEITARCVLGKGGVKPAADKIEGDGASPLGVWPIRRVLYRPDQGRPATRLLTSPLTPEDGWCDAAGDMHYNRPVRLPYPASHERLWRDDRVYDLIVVLGHNDDPVVPGAGSAIFWHLAQLDWRPTEGCVAVERATMLAALAVATPGATLAIKI